MPTVNMHRLCDHEQELPSVPCGCVIGVDHYTGDRLVRRSSRVTDPSRPGRPLTADEIAKYGEGPAKGGPLFPGYDFRPLNMEDAGDE